MSRRRFHDQPRPTRDHIPSLWLAVLGTVFLMLTGTLLLAMDGVRRNQEQSAAQPFTASWRAERAYN